MGQFVGIYPVQELFKKYLNYKCVMIKKYYLNNKLIDLLELYKN